MLLIPDPDPHLNQFRISLSESLQSCSVDLGRLLGLHLILKVKLVEHQPTFMVHSAHP